MYNYGGSIISAFPNTFMSSPASLKCQLCNNLISESESNFNASKQQFYQTRWEKCIHCGLNICFKCLNENQEHMQHLPTATSNDDILANSYPSKNYLFNGQYVSSHSTSTTQSQIHYNTVKKEFKQMYNYSKEIVEKLHLLNNVIKIEESAVSELNSIKHQVNLKAIELIKQINQEKADLIEQIENAKQKYESKLNERKEYYALSMQHKDELRKIIRKYKDFKSEENCSLNDLLKMYNSVKVISKDLDDYDHIKLVTEQEPLQVNFEDRPTYRNLIGRLLLNEQPFEIAMDDSKPSTPSTPSSEISINQNNMQTSFTSKISFTPKVNQLNQSDENKQIFQSQNKFSNRTNKNINEMTRSVSLNDLISAANELITSTTDAYKSDDSDSKQNKSQDKTSTKPKPNVTFSNTNKNYSIISKSNTNLASSSNENDAKENNFKKQPFYLPTPSHATSQKNFAGLPPPLPSSTSSPLPSQKQKSSLNQENKFLSPNSLSDSKFSQSSSFGMIPKKTVQNQSYPPLQSILKNSDSKLNNSMNNNEINLMKTFSNSFMKRMEQYKEKKSPKERLEIDILPSHLNYANNKLLIASANGKIRVVDLFTYKIQKDELKNINISGICKPKSIESSADTFYAVTNGEMNHQDDVLDVRNSAIVVTRKELKVLKKNESSEDNDDYLFHNPSGICFDDFDNLYICDTGNNRVKILDANLVVKATIIAASSSEDYLMQPMSVVSYKNLLYVSDSGNKRIVCYYILDNGDEYQFKNQIILDYGNPSSFPMDLGVDDEGVLVVREQNSNRVHLFANDTTRFHSIEVNTQRNGETVYSMTVAENGDIFVSKMVNVNEINKYDQQVVANKFYIDIY